MEPPVRNLDDDTPARHAASRRSTLVSVAVNIMLSTGQIVVGFISASQGLIADGIHSLSDLAADFVVLLANHHSKKAPDEDHQYGHQRYENAASLVLGGLLLAVGLGMLWAAAHKLATPESIPQVHVVALWVALSALAAKELLFRYMLRVAERVRSTMLIANAWHARSDAASSLVVAGGIVGNLLGYPLLDPVAALVVGLMVARMGWNFAWSALSDLMDRAVDAETLAGMRAMIEDTPGVLGVHDLRTRKMADLIVVDVHLEVAGEIPVRAGHDIAEEVERRLMAAFPVLNVMTHVDPVEAGPS
ncbi:MAG: cation-efflux pump [Hydrogenophilales bacterium CG03_land_8_20_14_0_80_62_28]|nr:cation transporter [Betaproteobacteria bacterium]OIO77132.1 MAG: cation-efflux pump [Hydrogenophilaceae bacterium CG1_02_62_390]PIV22514.1 MAG: cation-efflux pump [Hydrogenophilales bacterium CG03_land_8_20_14_0_80_62_28]PIW38324.1 MAG: cation-efflux pump [Hydrogenophilales bacterium CG15_BIG_FIL_POST_REV_8_21_14_020_62_31]PIW72193.1 MAG: cation-efflux pump [Hydrogenophilales bacterium CG12_big_fil_rev_8_21_14_0_65_61_21]PIX02342.1 MAG: cation-efflux pump [Hydrogenophilales bacterium CG_4_8